MTTNQNSNSGNNNSNNKKSQARIRVANDNRQWITEKCGTNTPPPTPPQSPSTGNKKKGN